GDGDAEGGAAHVVEADAVAEVHAGGVAAVLAADAHLEAFAGGPAALDAHLHELADAGDVERLEGVAGEDLPLDVLRQEAGGIVAAVSEGELGEIVGAEAEEVGVGGDVAGGKRGAGDLDHGADLDVQRVLDVVVSADLVDDALDLVAKLLDLLLGPDQRDHDFRGGLDAVVLAVDHRLDDGAHLHAQDLGVADGEAAAAVAEHGVQLVELGDALAQLLRGNAQAACDLLDRFVVVGEELVQRRVEEADGDGQALHGGEDADEVVALEGQEFLEGRLAFIHRLGDNHLPHGGDAVALEEHVLGAAEADALGAELPGPLGIGRGVGVGADAHGAVLVGPAHDLGEVARERWADGGQFAGDHFAGGAVDRDDI